MGRMIRSAILLLPLLAIPVACADPGQPLSPAEQRPELSFSGSTMGVTWGVKVVVTAGGVPAHELLIGIQEALDRVDQRMSTYKIDSEVTRFSLVPAGQPFPVSDETAKVVREALRVAELSGGAFDPTVMPLVQLWGFGPMETEEEPTDLQVREALQRCGWSKLEVTEEDELKKSQDDLHLDLSAIAKGYGVDAVCEALVEMGYPEHLVDVGGELRAAGQSPRGKPWVVGIDAPRDMSAAGTDLQAVFEVHDHAIATSGDYRNFRIVDGQRIQHTLDPRDGRPVDHALASVTVLAPSCMEADALATTCMVLGPEDGLALIETLDGIEALFVLRGEDGFSTQASSGFPTRNPVE